MALPSSFRRAAIGAAVIASLPLPIVLVMVPTSGRLALLSCLLLPLIVLAFGHVLWPEWRRLGGLILIGPAVGTVLIGGFTTLAVLVIGSFCSSDGSRDYLSTAGAIVAVAGFAVPYALGSAWAVRRAERVLWAWPVAILLALAIGIAVLAIVEGGGHHCET